MKTHSYDDPSLMHTDYSIHIRDTRGIPYPISEMHTNGLCSKNRYVNSCSSKDSLQLFATHSPTVSVAYLGAHGIAVLHYLGSNRGCAKFFSTL